MPEPFLTGVNNCKTCPLRRRDKNPQACGVTGNVIVEPTEEWQRFPDDCMMNNKQSLEFCQFKD